MIESGKAGLTVYALVALAASACGDGTRPPSPELKISMLDPRGRHHELTYPEWAVAYMKWQFETSFSILLEVKDCTAGQDGDRDGNLDHPVAFLDKELAFRTEPRPCTFSSEKAILFPLLSLSSLTPYYTDPVIKAAKHGVDAADVSPQELEASIEEDFMQKLVIEEISIQVDGLELREPLSGRIGPTNYSYAPYPGDNSLFHFYEVEADRIPELVEHAFVAGYWILLPPLGRGAHELSVFVRVRTGGRDVQVIHEQFTYHLALD
jgi:hypothetical protein